MANQQKRQQDLRKRREVNRIIPLIINNDWEDAERGGELRPQDFFQQNHIRSSTTFEYKIAVMFTMLRENLKFPQLENVTDDNPQELHHLLMNLFGTTEDNTLSMIHIFACILSNKSNNLIKNLINNSAQGQSIFMERWGRAGMTLLHWVCHNNASDDVIDKLIDVGGRKLVMATDKFERSALQLAFHTNASDNIITSVSNSSQDTNQHHHPSRARRNLTHQYINGVVPDSIDFGPSLSIPTPEKWHHLLLKLCLNLYRNANEGISCQAQTL